MEDSLSYLDLLLPRDITPKKETLGRKKHNREDRTEVIIVSDRERGKKRTSSQRSL